MAGANQRKTISSQQDLVTEISLVVMEITGVQLKERQRSMVEARLGKRISELGLQDEQEYREYFNQHRELEVGALVSLLTTHHTYFFREYSHFEYLESFGIQAAVGAARARGDKKIRIWSAACSRGQEVYSLSMFLKFHLSKIAPDFTYEILGTDIDPESLAIAKNGVFHRDEIKEIPLPFLSGNWAKGTGEIEDYVKAKASIRESCKFEVINLLNIGVNMAKKFDIIFCRNVFIYFTPEQIRLISENFLGALTPQGILFIGISESLNGMKLPLTLLGPSIYTPKKPELKEEKNQKSVEAIKSPPPAEVPANILKVLCVDDSPSVITLLKQILKKENGFEVVAVAGNGIEATKKLKEMKIDVMTLDIHMPEQTGLEYLQKNMGASHPPVVMISSVSRENADLAMKCLESGATDYVEKPALSNLKERGDEIRMKLACAARRKQNVSETSLALDKSFASLPVISQPGECFRLVLASLSDRKKLQKLFAELKGEQPPSLILMEGCETAMPSFVKSSKGLFERELTFLDQELPQLLPGKAYIADFSKFFDRTLSTYGTKRSSILVYGQVTPSAESKILRWSHAQLLVEDLGKLVESTSLREVATDIAPATSFAYCSTEFLSKKNG